MSKNLLILLFCSTNFVIHAQKSDTLQFVWAEDSLSGQYYEKAAMLIPIQFENDTTTYYFQLDTGSDASFLYLGNENGIKINFPLTPDLKFQSSIGKIELDTIRSMSPALEGSFLIIGTIGANVLKDKTLWIDFPNQQVLFNDSLNRDDFQFFPIELNNGRPTLLFHLGDAVYYFMFDTGSSIFELLATKKTWNKFRNKTSENIIINIWSWGTLSPSVTTKMEKPLELDACPRIQLKNVSYSTNKKMSKSFKVVGISGVIGNKPFLNEVIIIDVSTKFFGIKCQ